MDKNVVIAIGLSFVIIFGFTLIQSKIAPEDPNGIVSEETVEPLSTPVEDNSTTSEISSPDAEAVTASVESDIEEAPLRTITAETDLFEIEFSTAGAVITSLRLKEHKDGEELVNMVYKGESDRNAFEISFGRNYSKPITENFFYMEDYDPETYIFYQDFAVPQSDGTLSPSFRLIKTYRFLPDNYMMELVVTIENSVNEYIPLNYNGYAYTLTYGPQIGPSFEKLDGRYTYRYLVSYDDKKLKTYNKGKTKQIDESTTDMVEWSGIVGKYFGIAAITDSSRYEIGWNNAPIDGLEGTSFLTLSRPVIESARNSDTYRFFIGPKNKRLLESYNDPNENPFNYSDTQLEAMSNTGSFMSIGFLEAILKWILEMVYKVIPNYGVAIIIMTILIKVALFPITHKSYESTSKMSAIQPKMKELQAKYKDDPKRLNVEMSQLYQKEGVNPMSGCLPMVLQMPILFAVYGMLMKYFDLRGAVFIPGWITDLSAPEAVYTFANFTIPILKSNAIRLLPIIYVASQLLSMRFTQSSQAATGGQSAMQQKMFMYAMPLIFFFVLYNVPSGLLIYWIVMNVLTTGQQFYINKAKQKKENQ